MAAQKSRSKTTKSRPKATPIEKPYVFLMAVAFTVLSIVFAVTAYINYR